MPDLTPSAPIDLSLLAGATIALGVRGLVSGGEAALAAVGRERAEELSGRWGGKSFVALKGDTERSAAAVRTAYVLSLVTATAFAAAFALQLVQRQGLTLSTSVTVLVAGALTWLASMLVDVVPRSLGTLHPETWALATAPPLRLLRLALTPPARLVTAAANLLLRPAGTRALFGHPPPPLDELEHLLTQSREAGAPEPALVRSLFEFGERTVKEIMVPRTDVSAIPESAPPEEIARLLVEEGHTRMPVYRGNLDEIIGIVHSKDVLPLIANPQLIIIQDLVRPTIYVPWNRPIAQVLRELQQTRQHLAVVVDEYGGMAGIITLEDIVEQIVGDIRDEFDVEVPDVTPLDSDESLVRADMRVEEFNALFEVDLPEEAGYETIGGFLSTLAGEIPGEGDRFYHQGLEFVVTRRDPRRVLEVRVARLRSVDEDEEAQETGRG